MGRWRRQIIGSLLGAGVSAMGAPGLAQSVPLPGVPGAAPAVPEGLLASASAEVLYDSNELRSSFVSSSFPNAHRDDFRYSPLLAATYGRSSGLIALTANGLIGRDFFQYNHFLDSNRYAGGGTLVYHSGSSCQASFNGNYSSRQAGIRGAGAVIIDPSGAPVDDVGQLISNVLTASTYGANAGCGSPAGRLAFGGGYTHSAINNAAASRQYGNSDADSFTGNLGLGIFRPGQLSLNGSYTTIVYPDRTGSLIVNGVQLVNTGIKTYRVGLSFARPIGTKLSGSIGVAYLHSDPTGGTGAYNSPAYNIALNYIPSGRLTFALTGLRDILPSITAGALFRVVDQVLLSSQYSLGSNIKINVNAGVIANQYKGSFAVGGTALQLGSEPVRHNDTTETAGIGLTYMPRKLYDVAFNVTQTMRSSDPSTFNYSSTRVGLTVAVHI